jgi:peptide/nickel transport system permease protein
MSTSSASMRPPASARAPSSAVAARTARARRWLRRHWTAAFGALVLALMIVGAAAAPWIAPYHPGQQDLLNSLIPPAWQRGGTWAHPLGTDQLGRDVLTWLIYGSRISLIVGFSAVVLSGVLAFPFILLALLVAALFGQGLGKLIIVLAATGWAPYARVVRAETLAAHARPYVEAARSLGLSNARIIARHVFPNLLAPVIVIASVSVALMMIQEAALSFLGLGVPPNVPSWGGMLADGRNYLAVAWWLGTLPGLAILVAVLGINLLGDWLRDMLDPSLRSAA